MGGKNDTKGNKERFDDNRQSSSSTVRDGADLGNRIDSLRFAIERLGEEHLDNKVALAVASIGIGEIKQAIKTNADEIEKLRSDCPTNEMLNVAKARLLEHESKINQLTERQDDHSAEIPDKYVSFRLVTVVSTVVGIIIAFVVSLLVYIYSTRIATVNGELQELRRSVDALPDEDRVLRLIGTPRSPSSDEPSVDTE